MDLVFGERGTNEVSRRALDNIDRASKVLEDIRETLDELELVLDLAALVGALLLSAVVCQSHCIECDLLKVMGLRIQLVGAGTLLERDL